MAKILISALGAGRSNRQYPKAKYKIEESIYEESFIGNALSKHFKIDKNIVIGTKKSLWEELYVVAAETHNISVDDEFSLELADKIPKGKIDKTDIIKLENLLQNKYKGLLIEYGLNNIELMANFEILMSITEELNDKDEIYIDITNSFRSLSLYMFIIINYLKSVSNINITISYISYGMFEAKDDNEGITPVVNLNLLYEAIEWIKAASEFKKFGNSYELTKLMNSSDKNSGKKLNDFTDALNLSYVNDLKNQIKTLYKSKNEFQKIQGFAKFIIPPVVDDFLKRFEKYNKEKYEYLFQIEVSKLFYDKGFFSSAYMFLHEAIITYLVECDNRYKTAFSRKEERNIVKDQLVNYLNHPKYSQDEEFKTLAKIYNELTPVRNSMAHAIKNLYSSTLNKPDYVKDFEKRYFNPINEIFKKNRKFLMFPV